MLNSLQNPFSATYGGQFMTQYPLTIYGDFMRALFTFVIPMAFINYYPALWLLDKPDPLGGPTALLAFIAPFVCLLMFAIGVWLWRTGVRHYTSTGS